MHELFSALATWVTSVVQSGGYLGIAGLTFLENLFPPIPSELILPVAGFLVRNGELGFVWVVVAATVGSVVGALVFYWLGYALGEQRLRAFICRYGRWLAMDEDDLDQARAWFERHGGMAVLIGRLVPSIRSIISIPAGIAKMPLVPFVAYTTIGSALWNTILVGGGWALGAQWERIEPFMNVIEWVSIVAVVGSVVWWFARKRHKKETAAAAG
jgi:membrane protein DedA with SNARE-associated domain